MRHLSRRYADNAPRGVIVWECPIVYYTLPVDGQPEEGTIMFGRDSARQLWIGRYIPPMGAGAIEIRGPYSTLYATCLDADAWGAALEVEARKALKPNLEQIPIDF